MESIKDKLGLTMHQDSMTSEDHEKFRIECNGRAYLHGLVVGPLTFCSVYFAQKFFTKRMERSIGHRFPVANLVSSGILGIMLTYMITNTKLEECSKNLKSRQFAERRRQENPLVK